MRTLKDLLKLDGECNHHADNTTPMHLRTPAWFIDLYMKHMAQAGEARHWRPVFDADSDSDVGPNGRMRGNREHILRHVPRAEVCSLFAAHAEWVVGDLELGRAQWLDLESWRAWINDIARTRKLAAREGISWGVPPGVQVSPEEEDEEEGEEEDLPSRLRSRMAQQGKKTRQVRSGSAVALIQTPISRSLSAPLNRNEPLDVTRPAPTRAQQPQHYVQPTHRRTARPACAPPRRKSTTPICVHTTPISPPSRPHPARPPARPL